MHAGPLCCRRLLPLPAAACPLKVFGLVCVVGQVEAVSACVCLRVGREAFRKLLGPLHAELESRMPAASPMMRRPPREARPRRPPRKRAGYAHETGDDEPKMVAEATKFASQLGFVTSPDDILLALHNYRVSNEKNVAMRLYHASSVLNN